MFALKKGNNGKTARDREWERKWNGRPNVRANESKANKCSIN